jgi:ketosteroid isomerase-like protein
MLRMMKRFSFALLLVAAGWSGGGYAQSPAPAPAAQISVAEARRLLEAAYAENRRAHLAKDLDAVLRQRSPDFQAILPDGRVVTAEQQAEASRNLLDNVEEWVDLTLSLGEARIAGDALAVDVTQHTIRRQMRDGAVRRIENWVIQTETWVRTPDGLRIRRVENIRDQCVLIEGRIREGIDPEACRRHGVTGG